MAKKNETSKEKEGEEQKIALNENFLTSLLDKAAKTLEAATEKATTSIEAAAKKATTSIKTAATNATKKITAETEKKDTKTVEAPAPRQLEKVDSKQEKFGIQNIKNVALFGVKLGNALDSILEDKKIAAAEFLQLFNALSGIGSALEGISEVPKELNDLSELERTQLNAFVKSNLSLTNDKVEGVIEESVNLCLSLIQFKNKMVDIFKKEG